MIVIPIKTRILRPGESLVDFIIEHISEIKDGSVLVVTSKIAGLAENRRVRIEDNVKKEQIIKEEADIALKNPYGWLTVRNGLMVGSGGIDESNAEGGYYIMLPKDCSKVAWDLHTKLKEHYQILNLGIILTDSRMMPLKQGTLGAAFGYAGIKPLRSYIGKHDLFGRKFKRQRINVVDSLATAAVFEMGEGAESTPLAVITHVNIEFIDNREQDEDIKINPEDDIYYFFYRAIE